MRKWRRAGALQLERCSQLPSTPSSVLLEMPHTLCEPQIPSLPHRSGNTRLLSVAVKTPFGGPLQSPCNMAAMRCAQVMSTPPGFFRETLRVALVMLRVRIKGTFQETLTEALPGIRDHALGEGCLGYNARTGILFFMHSISEHTELQTIGHPGGKDMNTIPLLLGLEFL